jgi:hypothetical protein
MNLIKHMLVAGIGGASLVCGALALAALPPPSPEQAQKAAAKKAQADAQAQKEKQELVATMDAIAARWRARAAKEGKPINPPVPVAAQTAALSAPAAGSAPAGQPGGKLGPAATAAPVRSEKAGTAPPSADVKKKPSEPMRRQGQS